MLKKKLLNAGNVRVEIRSTRSFKLEHALLVNHVQRLREWQKIFLQSSLSCCSFKRPPFQLLERKARMKCESKRTPYAGQQTHVRSPNG